VKLLLLAALVAAMASCGGTSAPSSGNTGIEGRVMIGPTCAAEQQGSPCPAEPYEAELEIVRAGTNEVVTEVRSDSDGRFSVALAPGRYIIRSTEAATTPPFSRPVAVTVPDGGVARVKLVFDSGIRGAPQG
jgi:hypothetical protein